MTAAAASDFLADIPVFAEFDDIANLSRYRRLPEGWSLAMADVVSSGPAIAAGKYKMVNMAGAAVITAVLNTLGRFDYPFVFGGDGAVVAIPDDHEPAVRKALSEVATWISEELGLEMRVALIPISDIRARNLDVQVARFRTGPDLAFAMLAGGGSSWAEAQMKQGHFAVAPAPAGSKPDLTGLSCRWNPVEARNGQIVSVIAVPGPLATDESFRALVSKVVTLSQGDSGGGNPLPEEGPTPVLHFAGVDVEARSRAPVGKRLAARLRIITQIIVTYVLYRTNLSLGGFNARAYSRELVHNTDFRKFDDGLKMTIDVDDATMHGIEAVLQEAAETGICAYGLHSQTSALVTCIVPSVMSHDHMHFIDGASGGYAQAALQMKAMVRATALPHGQSA